MKNLLILIILFSSFVQAQSFTIFENNKKNKALFDYSDPNSLVSMLVQNQGLLTNSGCNDGLIKGLSNESLHSVEGLKSFSCSGEPWQIEGDDENATRSILMRDSDSENFDDWFNRLTTQGKEPDFDPAVFGPLTRTNKIELEQQYNLAPAGFTVKRPPLIGYYDVNDIELIILNANNIYFAKKSLYENKYFICLQLTIEELTQLGRFDFLNEDLSKKITSKLREFQLAKRELDAPEYPTYAISEYWNPYHQANLFDDFNLDEFKYYTKSSSIKRIFPGASWEIEGDDEDYTKSILYRESKQESFEAWFTRLTTQGNLPDFNPEIFGVLTRIPEKGTISKESLKTRYEACGENQALRLPDSELIYWVDYPNPAVYLKRNFETDSTGKFKTKFSQLLFTERLDNKKGYSQKPQVLMAFGEPENSINQEILVLLKEEIMTFDMKQDFAWKKIISANKGRSVKNDELKKMIHCFEINENSIEY
jgi:hypothetical protein